MMPTRIPRSLKRRQASTFPPSEPYPYSTLPVLFFVCFSLVFLACLHSPKPTSQFITTYNTHPRQDSGFRLFAPPPSLPPATAQRSVTRWLGSGIMSAFKIEPADVFAFLHRETKRLSLALIWDSARGSGGVVRRVGVSALYSEDPSRFDMAQQQQHPPPPPPPAPPPAPLQNQLPFSPPPPFSPSSPLSAAAAAPVTSDETSVRLLPGERTRNAMFAISFTVAVLLMVMVLSQTM